MVRLQDRIALLTGSGNGIGRATAEAYAAEGAFVYVTDLDGAAAETVAAGIVAKGGQAAAAAMDVSKGQDVSAVMRRVKAERDRFVGFVVDAVHGWPPEQRLMGRARFIDDHTLDVDGHTAVQAARIVIATGSSPAVPRRWRDDLPTTDAPTLMVGDGPGDAET